MEHPRYAIVLCLGAALLGGCAELATRDGAREKTLAKADHAQCELEGHAFPAAAYDTCRRREEEQRRRKQWFELTLAEQQAATRSEEIVNLPPPSVYHAIDPKRWRCERMGEGTGSWIACREL